MSALKWALVIKCQQQRDINCYLTEYHLKNRTMQKSTNDREALNVIISGIRKSQVFLCYSHIFTICTDHKLSLRVLWENNPVLLLIVKIFCLMGVSSCITITQESSLTVDDLNHIAQQMPGSVVMPSWMESVVSRTFRMMGLNE